MEDSKELEESGLATVTGYILPNGWNEDFSVSSVLIADDQEREFVVGNLDNYPELRDLCRRKIAATGYLYARQSKTFLDLATYVILQDVFGKEERQ